MNCAVARSFIQLQVAVVVLTVFLVINTPVDLIHRIKG